MDKLVYTSSDWLIVNQPTSMGITKVFSKESLESVLSFSKKAFNIIKQENFTESAMLQINGFECVISIRIESNTKISNKELHLTNLINEAYAS